MIYEWEDFYYYTEVPPKSISLIELSKRLKNLKEIVEKINVLEDLARKIKHVADLLRIEFKYEVIVNNGLFEIIIAKDRIRIVVPEDLKPSILSGGYAEFRNAIDEIKAKIQEEIHLLTNVIVKTQNYVKTKCIS